MSGLANSFILLMITIHAASGHAEVDSIPEGALAVADLLMSFLHPVGAVSAFGKRSHLPLPSPLPSQCPLTGPH